MPRPMPQRSKISDGKGWPLERRPELACYIGRIAAFWSRVEERLGHMINRLLGAEPRLGMIMFRAVSATSDKIAILRALAAECMPKELQVRLDELISWYGSAKWARDRIIRGHWYVSDEHPDALIWANPADEFAGAAAFWSGFRSSGDFGQQLKFARDYAPPRPDYLIFEKSDFEEVLQDFRNLGFALTDFLLELSEAQGQPAAAEG